MYNFVGPRVSSGVRNGARKLSKSSLTMVRPSVFRFALFLALMGWTALMLNAQTRSDLSDIRQYFKSIAGGPYIYLQGANSDMSVGTLMAEVDGTQFFVRRP